MSETQTQPRAVQMKVSVEGSDVQRRFAWEASESSVQTLVTRVRVAHGLSEGQRLSLFVVNNRQSHGQDDKTRIVTDGDLALALFHHTASQIPATFKLHVAPEASNHNDDEDDDGFDMVSQHSASASSVGAAGSESDLVDLDSRGAVRGLISSRVQLHDNETDNESTVESVEDMKVYTTSDIFSPAVSVLDTDSDTDENPFLDPDMDALIESVSKSMLLEAQQPEQAQVGTSLPSFDEEKITVDVSDLKDAAPLDKESSQNSSSVPGHTIFSHEAAESIPVSVSAVVPAPFFDETAVPTASPPVTYIPTEAYATAPTISESIGVDHEADVDAVVERVSVTEHVVVAEVLESEEKDDSPSLASSHSCESFLAQERPAVKEATTCAKPIVTEASTSTKMEPTSCVNDFCEDIQPLLNALLVKIEANPNLIHVLLQQLPETLAGYNFGLTIENPDGSVRASAATTSSSVRSDCRAAEDAGQSKTQREHIEAHRRALEENLRAHEEAVRRLNGHVHPVPAFGHLPLPLHLPPFDHHHNSTNYPPPQMPSHHMPPYHPPAYNHGLAPYQFHGPRHGYHHGGRGWNGRPSFRSSPVAQPPQPVCTTNWSNIICNGCNKSGFTGPRHKCASCSDYDLCATCFADAAKSHTAGHKFFTLTTKDQQHRNIFCDGCKIRGIVGDRFKCTVCFDYDLCGVCHRAAGLMHAGHAFTQIMPGSGTTVEACERVVKQVEEAGFEWRGVVCDGCDRSNFRGKRYRCDDASCADYDLCESCFTMDAAVHTHTTFIELTSFDQMHRHVGCDGCGRMSMVGSRYKCMDCPNFDLCQKCIASARDAHVPGHWFNRLDARERFARRVVSLAASLKTKDEVPLEQRVGPCVFAREETLLNMTIEAEVMEEKVEIGAEEAAGAVELTCKQAVEEHDLARSASEVTFKQDFAGSASEMTFKQAVERDLARSASSATSTSIASSVHSRVVPISYAKVAATLSPAAPTPVMPGSFPIVLPAPIHPPVTGNTEVPILESGTAANDYAQQQVALFEMGFMNPSVNFEVLARCNGDLVKATEELIEKGPAAREILEDGDEEESGDRYDSLEWRALF